MALGGNIGLLASFAGGMISFVSPCVLPLVPGYVSYISGHSVGAPRGPWFCALFPGLSFVLGFATVFVALGASATLIGQFLLSYRYALNLVGGALVIIFGLFATGLVPLPWLERDLRYHGAVGSGGETGAYILGLAFGFGWTPCIGPVLGAILTVSAATATVKSGILLLAAYSLGLGLPFLAAALFTESLMRRMAGMRKLGRILKIGAGGVMILMGIAMMTGYMTRLAYWLLETFPTLSTIG